MASVIVEKECGCFKNSDFVNNEAFASKDDAMLKAQHMLEFMNNEFCGKHEFELSEQGDDMVIAFAAQEEAPRSGCCGGGHCS